LIRFGFLGVFGFLEGALFGEEDLRAICKDGFLREGIFGETAPQDDFTGRHEGRGVKDA
jgi:hypothetical protein